LLRHAKGLRALARGLLRDEHAAEDVVQETWTLALGKPPRDRAHAGSWLRQVALSLALKRRRGEGRRALREQRVARREETPAVDETVAHREVLRCVTDAVLGLEEPYQTAVILRYYEDLSPREIARRLGVPVATVDSQLHRARATLRRRLTARTGDRDGWMHALAALTGWRGRALTTAGTATLGGIPMFIKLTLGLATAGLLWTGLVPRPEAARPPPPRPRVGRPARRRRSRRARPRSRTARPRRARRRATARVASRSRRRTERRGPFRARSAGTSSRRAASSSTKRSNRSPQRRSCSRPPASRSTTAA
jgi:RNA polymerase sigma-70 factor (ECF subfamily)